MNKRRIRWIIAAIVVLALLHGAYRIVTTRNQIFYGSGLSVREGPAAH
jgi:hypothetical protein